MKAVAYSVPGAIEREDALLDITLETPKAEGRDLLVNIKAVSVNPVDTKVRKARPPEGGLVVFSAWVLRDEINTGSLEAQKKWFFDKTPINGRKAIGSRVPNSPRHEFVEDGVDKRVRPVAAEDELPVLGSKDHRVTFAL